MEPESEQAVVDVDRQVKIVEEDAGVLRVEHHAVIDGGIADERTGGVGEDAGVGDVGFGDGGVVVCE